jgi:hypothetical protein
MSVVSSFLLKDSSGQLWKVTVNDLGALRTQSVPSGSGVPITLILDDPLVSTSWQVGVSTLGALTTTSVTFNAGDPTAFNMSSTTGLTAWSVGVTSNGDLTTSPFTITGVFHRVTEGSEGMTNFWNLG